MTEKEGNSATEELRLILIAETEGEMASNDIVAHEGEGRKGGSRFGSSDAAKSENLDPNASRIPIRSTGGRKISNSDKRGTVNGMDDPVNDTSQKMISNANAFDEAFTQLQPVNLMATPSPSEVSFGFTSNSSRNVSRRKESSETFLSFSKNSDITFQATPPSAIKTGELNKANGETAKQRSYIPSLQTAGKKVIDFGMRMQAHESSLNEGEAILKGFKDVKMDKSIPTTKKPTIDSSTRPVITAVEKPSEIPKPRGKNPQKSSLKSTDKSSSKNDNHSESKKEVFRERWKALARYKLLNDEPKRGNEVNLDKSNLSKSDLADLQAKRLLHNRNVERMSPTLRELIPIVKDDIKKDEEEQRVLDQATENMDQLILNANEQAQQKICAIKEKVACQLRQSGQGSSSESFLSGNVHDFNRGSNLSKQSIVSNRMTPPGRGAVSKTANHVSYIPGVGDRSATPKSVSYVPSPLSEASKGFGQLSGTTGQISPHQDGSASPFRHSQPVLDSNYKNLIESPADLSCGDGFEGLSGPSKREPTSDHKPKRRKPPAPPETSSSVIGGKENDCRTGMLRRKLGLSVLFFMACALMAFLGLWSDEILSLPNNLDQYFLDILLLRGDEDYMAFFQTTQEDVENSLSTSSNTNYPAPVEDNLADSNIENYPLFEIPKTSDIQNTLEQPDQETTLEQHDEENTLEQHDKENTLEQQDKENTFLAFDTLATDSEDALEEDEISSGMEILLSSAHDEESQNARDEDSKKHNGNEYATQQNSAVDQEGFDPNPIVQQSKSVFNDDCNDTETNIQKTESLPIGSEQPGNPASDFYSASIVIAIDDEEASSLSTEIDTERAGTNRSSPESLSDQYLGILSNASEDDQHIDSVKVDLQTEWSQTKNNDAKSSHFSSEEGNKEILRLIDFFLRVVFLAGLTMGTMVLILSRMVSPVLRFLKFYTPQSFTWMQWGLETMELQFLRVLDHVASDEDPSNDNQYFEDFLNDRQDQDSDDFDDLSSIDEQEYTFVTKNSIPKRNIDEEKTPTGSAGRYRAVEIAPVHGTPYVQMRHVRRSLRNAPTMQDGPVQIPAAKLQSFA